MVCVCVCTHFAVRTLFVFIAFAEDFHFVSFWLFPHTLRPTQPFTRKLCDFNAAAHSTYIHFICKSYFPTLSLYSSFSHTSSTTKSYTNGFKISRRWNSGWMMQFPMLLLLLLLRFSFQCLPCERWRRWRRIAQQHKHTHTLFKVKEHLINTYDAKKACEVESEQEKM